MAALYYGKDVKNEIDKVTAEMVRVVIFGTEFGNATPDHKLAVIEGIYAMAAEIKDHFDKKEEEA